MKQKRKNLDKRQQIIILIIVVAVVIFSALLFSPQQSSYIDEIPDFIDPESVADGDSCIVIIPEEIWEQGDNGEELSRHLMSDMTISTGSERNLSYLELSFRMDLGSVSIVDDHGNLVGFVGSPIQTCAYPNGLYFGGKHLMLEFTSLSGQAYEFYWYADTFRRY
ncbi:MAG: hypothetical protein AAF846_15625 [Chloroflexota bacterium]